MSQSSCNSIALIFIPLLVHPNRRNWINTNSVKHVPARMIQELEYTAGISTSDLVTRILEGVGSKKADFKRVAGCPSPHPALLLTGLQRNGYFNFLVFTHTVILTVSPTLKPSMRASNLSTESIGLFSSATMMSFAMMFPSGVIVAPLRPAESAADPGLTLNMITPVTFSRSVRRLLSFPSTVMPIAGRMYLPRLMI